MARLLAFVRLSRPHFLLGGFLMFALGAAFADRIAVAAYVAAQAMITAAQITAHYANEYADYDADLAVVNRTSFSGGSGALTSGALPRFVALRAAQVTTGLCLIAAVFTARYSPAAAVLGVIALGVSWTYSMPPIRLLNTGFGEFVTALTVAGLVPATGALSQLDRVPQVLWWMMAMLVVMQFAMLLAFELPDLDSDRDSDKTVLGVRIGERATRLTVVACIFLVCALDIAAISAQQISASAGRWSLLCAPTAVVMVVAAERRKHALTTLGAVATYFLLGVGFLVSVF